MPLPIDLVLVRHGESEGNIASRRSRKGDHSYFTDTFRSRHSSSYRLSDKGIVQAKKAGEWLKQNLPKPYFDRYLASEYIRAMETAAYLDLPEADWQIDFFLREREWGDLDGISIAERDTIYEKVMQRKEAEPFYWTPPNGESFASLCSNRIKWVLNTLARDYSDRSAILVCHGEVLWAFRIMLERIRQSDFKRLYNSEEPECKMINCQIFHYTRKNPVTGKIHPKLHWVRTIDPEGTFETEWRTINPGRFTSNQLLKIARKQRREISE